MIHTSSPLNVEAERHQARQHLDQGAVTASDQADRPTVLKMLNDSLAIEIVCVLRYRRHQFRVRGIHSQAVAAEFLAHSNEEQGHAEYVEGTTLSEMIVENLVAERIAIDSYRPARCRPHHTADAGIHRGRGRRSCR